MLKLGRHLKAWKILVELGLSMVRWVTEAISIDVIFTAHFCYHAFVVD